MHYRSINLIVIMAVIGLGLTINCLAGIFRRDGIYDAGSERMMNFSQYLGVAIGLALLYAAYHLYILIHNTP